MPPEKESAWSHTIRSVLSFLGKEEVKTPLSFYFKAAGYFVVTLFAILYAPIEDDLKWRLVIVAAIVLLLICAIVTVFAWRKPKHLVYGELAHRAEYKLGFGTEKQLVPAQEVAELEGTAIPRPLDATEEAK